MASLTRKIRKRAKRFNDAMTAIEKQLAQAQAEVEATEGESPDNSFEKFDLSSVISADVEAREEAKRKARNKRKSERKKRKK